MADAQVFHDADEVALVAAAGALEGGELVVFPTDTVYGVAARPELRAATAALFEAKRRPRDLTIPVLVAGPEQMAALAVADGRAEMLAERFWPGSLTIVLPRTERSGAWDLGAELGTIALRMPDHPVALEVLRRSGPLATTSANRSGEPTPPDCEGVRAALAGSVAVYLCAGPAPAGTVSTMVDLTAGEPRVLREGALPGSDVLGAL
ncbi:MAG: L-threonylcarbamoyladenylate synthase [Actinomycetota bacterium]